jgi:hypothetical protein
LFSTFTIDLGNYPDICPQEMGIKVGYWGIDKSGKVVI